MPSPLLSRRALLALGGAAAAGSVVALRRGGRRRPGYPPLPTLDPRARHVVLISIDGMRPRSYLEPDAMGLAIPNLRRLAAAGATTRGARSVWPTVTYPAHATMVTGVPPTAHGIAANSPFDPLSPEDDVWLWYASALRSPTLWDAARAKGLRVGSVYWPVAVGAPIDFLFPQIWKTKTVDDDRLLRSWTAPRALADELDARGLALPAEHRTDRERAAAAVHLVRSRRPELLLVYLTDLDTASHHAGPDSAEARATLEGIDDHVGEIVTAVEAAGALAQTTFVIVSDHGFADVSRSVRPSVLLREAGLLDVDQGDRITAFRAALQPAGGLAAVVLARKDDAAAGARVTELFERAARDPASGIARVHRGDDVRARGGFPDAHIVLEAADGASFTPGAAGPLVVPSRNRGTHGYPPEDPRMLASLFLSGARARRGGALDVASLLDVAPTLASLLGVELPGVSGRVLSELIT